MSEKVKHSNLTLTKILLTMALFFIYWSVGTVIGRNEPLNGLKNFYGFNLYSSLLKILFCIPCFVWVKYYEKDLKFSLKNMFIKFNFKVFSLWFSIILVIELITMFIVRKNFYFNSDSIPLIFEFLIVGFTEEVICRGWVFNALYSKMDYKKANILQSAYFMVWHWIPYIINWTINGSININSLTYIITWNTLSVFVLGILFGYLLKKTKSITIPMIIHTSIDYLACLFYMT